jgi:hypothetical protein
VKAANLGVRFLLELCALAALGVCGWQVPDQIVASVLLAIAAPLLAAAVWGRWVAPKAGHRLDDPARLGVELLVFGAAVVGLLVADQPGWALALAVAYAVNVSLGFAWRQRAH